MNQLHRWRWREVGATGTGPPNEGALPANTGGFWEGLGGIVYAPRRVGVVLSAVVLFAAAFRLWDVGGPSLWLDELFSVAFADLPQHQLWSDWMLRETNPPLYYSLLHEWMKVFGRGEFAIRALSVTCGVASVPVMYLVGRQLHSHPVGLVSALLTAVSSQHLQFSQQARGYALGFLAAAVAIYALLRLTDRWLAVQPSGRRSVVDLALYATAASVAIYTHTTFVLLPLLANLYIIWLWWFRSPRRWRPLAGWALANALVLVVCAWWLWITLQQVSVEGGPGPISWIEKPSVRTALLRIQHVFFTRKFEAANYLFAIVFAATALWGLRRINYERRVLMTTFVAGIPLALLLLSLRQPVYMERTLFWAQAAYIPTLAAGAVSIPVRRFALPFTIAIVSAWFLDAIIWRRLHYHEPWREIARVVAARADRDDALMTGSGSVLVDFRYYCSQRCAEIRQLAMRQPVAKDLLHEYFRGAEVGPAEIRDALRGVDRIWVIHRGRGRGLDQLLARVAVLEESDVLASDPPVDVEPLPEGRMRLSRWRIERPTE